MTRLDFPISRRTLFRGAGAALALPWLEAMLPKSARAATSEKPPVRMAVLYMPNGVHPDMWTPTGEGDTWTLSELITVSHALGLLGEDVAAAGGVFKATKGLLEEFGPERVRDKPGGLGLEIVDEPAARGLVVGEGRGGPSHREGLGRGEADPGRVPALHGHRAIRWLVGSLLRCAERPPRSRRGRGAQGLGLIHHSAGGSRDAGAR